MPTDPVSVFIIIGSALWLVFVARCARDMLICEPSHTTDHKETSNKVQE